MVDKAVTQRYESRNISYTY